MSTEQASTASAEQVNKLEQALILERTRAENAERLAASYLANVEDLRRALRMLETGTAQPEQATEQAQSKVTEHANGKPNPATDTLTEPAVSNPELSPSTAVSMTVRAWRRLLGR
jgi:hypothetical protein